MSTKSNVKNDVYTYNTNKLSNGTYFVNIVTESGKTQLKFNDYDLVQFETGSAVIQKKSYPYLNYLINIMKKNPSYKLSLAGHTDNVGDRDKNVKLSQDRVDAVKAYVTSKGVNGSKVSTSAFGPDKKKYKNDSEAGRAGCAGGLAQPAARLNRATANRQACRAAHISWSRSAVQMRGFLMPLASS